jgi:hypothetical protein
MRTIPWHQPLVFRQMAVSLQAGATPELQLGALALRDQMGGCSLVYPPTQKFILGQGVLGGTSALGP